MMSSPLNWDRDERAMACHLVAGQLVVRYGWELLPQDVLGAQALAEIETAAGSPTRAVLQVYTLALYAACAGQEGRDRQDRAYFELYRYLYGIARWRLPDEAEDLAQIALEMTFFNLGRCRAPRAFLRFALYQLQDAARVLHRERARPVESLARPISAEGITLGEILVDEGQSDPAEISLVSELRERFVACANACERGHPRAAAQLEAVWLKYLAGLDDRTISVRLNKPVKLVHVLRSRGLRLLRAQPALRALAIDAAIGVELV